MIGTYCKSISDCLEPELVKFIQDCDLDGIDVSTEHATNTWRRAGAPTGLEAIVYADSFETVTDFGAHSFELSEANETLVNVSTVVQLEVPNDLIDPRIKPGQPDDPNFPYTLVHDTAGYIVNWLLEKVIKFGCQYGPIQGIEGGERISFPITRTPTLTILQLQWQVPVYAFVPKDHSEYDRITSVSFRHKGLDDTTTLWTKPPE